jgi:5-methylcytosine-specific restriction endonuclease McrA
MYRHFQRNKAAAKIQQREWERAAKRAQRAEEFISKPCPYCGTMMTMGDDNPNTLTSESEDHIVPRCKGGRATVVVCVACNRDKHHLGLGEYRAVLCVRRRTFHVFYFERQAALHLLWNALALFNRFAI